MSEILPAIFFGRGNPMNALMNRYTEGWRAVGRGIQSPKAILSISAHWYVPRTGGTIFTAPRTIHDLVAFRQSYIGFSILLREILS
jgi:4,5-DOPA dioxygenase extradiol